MRPEVRATVRSRSCKVTAKRRIAISQSLTRGVRRMNAAGLGLHPPHLPFGHGVGADRSVDQVGKAASQNRRPSASEGGAAELFKLSVIMGFLLLLADAFDPPVPQM